MHTSASDPSGFPGTEYMQQGGRKLRASLDVERLAMTSQIPVMVKENPHMLPSRTETPTTSWPFASLAPRPLSPADVAHTLQLGVARVAAVTAASWGLSGKAPSGSNW